MVWHGFVHETSLHRTFCGRVSPLSDNCMKRDSNHIVHEGMVGINICYRHKFLIIVWYKCNKSGQVAGPSTPIDKRLTQLPTNQKLSSWRPRWLGLKWSNKQVISHMQSVILDEINDENTFFKLHQACSCFTFANSASLNFCSSKTSLLDSYIRFNQACIMFSHKNKHRHKRNFTCYHFFDFF